MTRQRGGLRLVAWGGSDPVREALILGLDAGDVSPVLEIDGGFEVLVGEGRVDAIRPEFEVTREAIGAILRKRKKEALERSVSADAWKTYHAQIVLPETSLAAFRKAFDASPDTVVATWEGGQLKAREVASRSELDSLAAMPAADAQQQVEARIRATANGALFALEARARKMNEVAEVADAATDFREKLMLDALYGEHILKELKLEDGDVRAYFDAHKAEFFEQEKRRVAQILVGSETDAKAIAAQLAKGADFAQLAKSKSRDITTASAGGELGWITADHVPPSFGSVFQLAAGKNTNPVRSAAGWHIIKVVEIQPKRSLTFEESKERVATAVSEQKKRALRDVWLKKLNEAAKIEIDDAAIREFVKENPLDPNKPAPSMQHAMDGAPAGHGSGH
jgi:peptidyl-prolyl cis-trans isomerase C